MSRDRLPDDLPRVPDVIDLEDVEDGYGMIEVGEFAYRDARRMRQLAADAWRMGMHYFGLYFRLSRRADQLEDHAKVVQEHANQRIKEDQGRRGKGSRWRDL